MLNINDRQRPCSGIRCICQHDTVVPSSCTEKDDCMFYTPTFTIKEMACVAMEMSKCLERFADMLTQTNGNNDAVEMRWATDEERQFVENYIKSISKT